jgi:hypothetical protein
MRWGLYQGIGFFTLFRSAVPSPVMLGYAIVYAILALILAIHLFNRRDL